MKNNNGFTLLEILIALFIFTILSMMLVGALHTVTNAEVSTEKNADHVRKLQITLLMLSRDIEQAVNRPVLDASGKEEPAFVGTTNSFTLTHAGFANPLGTHLHSVFERTRYDFAENTLLRVTWPVLDQAPESSPHARHLLTDVTNIQFQYLDKNAHFHDEWPIEGGGDQPLPRAVKIDMTISQWGSISQLYVISTQPSRTTLPAPKP